MNGEQWRVTVLVKTNRERLTNDGQLVPVEFTKTVRFLDGPVGAAQAKARRILKGMFPSCRMRLGLTVRDRLAEDGR